MNLTKKHPQMLANIILFFIGLVAFSLPIFHQFIVRSDARYAVFALEMYHHGLTWFPMLFDKPYPDYMVTQTVLSYLSMKLLSSTSVYAVTLPSIVISAIALVQLYCLGALHDKRWAMFGVLFALLTSEFFTGAFGLGGDQYVVCSSLLAFHMAYTADLFDDKKRWLWLPVALILGFLFRGPLGLVVTAGAVGGYYMANGRLKALIGFGIVSVVMLGVCSAFLLFTAYLQGGAHFLHAAWVMEVGSRTQFTVYNFHDPVRYFQTSLARFSLTLPFTLLALIGLLPRVWRVQNDPALSFLRSLMGWFLVVWLCMAIPGAGKPRYVIAVTPAMALIAAYVFVMPKPGRWLTILKQVLSVVALLFPWVVLIGAITAFVYMKQTQVVIPMSFIPLCMTAAIAVIASLWVWMKGVRQYAFYALLIFTLLYVGVNAFLVRNLLEHNQDATTFIQRVQALQQPGQAIVFYQLGKDEDSLNYMANVRPYFAPIYVNSEKALKAIKAPSLFVASAKTRLPKGAVIKVRGHLGRMDVVAFEENTE